MWLVAKPIVVSLLWGASLVLGAVDINGDQVVAPVTDDDPSPISDSETYYPDQYDCPLPCVDYTNVNSWTTYFSVNRLKRCQEPMLLRFSVSQALDDPKTNVLIRSCTLGSVSVADVKNSSVAASGAKVENPKKAKGLFKTTLESAPACAITGKEIQEKLQVLESSHGEEGDASGVVKLLEGMQEFFNAADNCDETFLFAYHNQAVAGAYIGGGLGKPTAKSALGALAGRFQTDGFVANRTIAQLCGNGREAERVFGVAINTVTDLPAVQKTALGWSQGTCAPDDGLESAGDLSGVKVFDIAQAPLDGVPISSSNNTLSNPTNTTSNSTITSRSSPPSRLWKRLYNLFEKRATCKYIQVAKGDGCASLAAKCGIRGADFTKYNPKTDLCSTLKENDYVCCSEGDPYEEPKPDAPKPNPDGTCATHLIVDGDDCATLAKQYGLTVDQIEGFNKNKTWAWTECKDMMFGYNMCLSNGTAPLPPPQQGAECGPVMPGTEPLTNKSMSLADLNPCPLKACCSNWGFCGPFSVHCDVHAPKGGGPGTRLPGFQNTCVSNCGNEIKQNSGPPATFERIGYYESWNRDRDCLWLDAKNANTDGTYTHMHWGFLEIDPATWKPVIKDPHKQWDEFKKLGIKRIVSFGGWAYSTEAATYNIIRQAIIDNRETFATNVAQFVKDEGLDGVDIDWEYPGAPDIMVGGQPIGQKGDGVAYLRFLTTLKQKLPDKSVSIAAPASYWYLKAFPIDRIAAVIDYIVYMTYDLHGQWDYGNPNAFDSCESGKCIRSHVNLTETRNSLSIITKAGVPNNKIFVGESSYGRSFHMATDGCWGPMCEFTGSRTESDATPGRCTNTGGYISIAEINEIIGRGEGAETFHDGDSNTDVMLFKGDYISYMTPTTKDTRREDWKALNFAGSIDWAVDLQAFNSEDKSADPGNGKPGEQGCVGGVDETVNSAELCEFACAYDFCPKSLCKCRVEGTIKALPAVVDEAEFIAHDDFDVDMNRLCKFACKYGYCPDTVCTKPPNESDSIGDEYKGGDPMYDWNVVASNRMNCYVYDDPSWRDYSVNSCLNACQNEVAAAKAEGRTTNYGCVGFWPLDKPIPWESWPGGGIKAAAGKCSCDNWLVNEIADTVIEAMPIIAQIGCYIVMSSLKLVLDVGLTFATGGAAKILDAGLDMAATAAQMASYLYPEEEDPEGAFSWWLSPCGGTDLVPDDIKEVFGILNSIADGVSSFKKPDKIKKGSGKKGDSANPTDRSKPKQGTGTGPNGTGAPPKRKCFIKPADELRRMGESKNTLRRQRCDQGTTKKNDLVVTSLVYAANAKPTKIISHCEKAHTQACYHYSSAIRVNPQWETITCPPAAASTAHRLDGDATSSWSLQHNGRGWQDESNRREAHCDKDEYPPAYLLDENDPAFQLGGINAQGQLVRWVPWDENEFAGRKWKGACFKPAIVDISDSEFERKHGLDKNPGFQVRQGATQTMATITVDLRPEWSFGSWGHAGVGDNDDGLWENPCWPNMLAPEDPGFALLTFDPWYGGQPPPYNYKSHLY